MDFSDPSSSEESEESGDAGPTTPLPERAGDDAECGESDLPADEAFGSSGEVTEELAGPDTETTSYDPATATALLMEVEQLEAPPTLEEARAYLRRVARNCFPPAEARAVQVSLSKRTGWPMSVISQMATDERNRIGNRVLGSITEAVEAVCTLLGEQYTHFIWNGGCGYGYTDENGYHVRLTPSDLERMITAWLGRTTFAEKQSQRKELLQQLAQKTEDRTYFDDLPPGVNVANGFVGWDPKEGFVLRPTSHETRSRERLPFPCDPEAECPHFLRALHRLLPSEEKRGALQEVFGAAVFGLTPSRDAARRIVFLNGQRNSGKSTLLAILQMFVPDYATASVSPDEWGNEVGRALLEGVHLNIVTELGGRHELAGEHVKRIASCEPILGRLPYGQPRTFRPYAWHVFATNELPRVSDKTSAFERRVIVFNFDRPLQQAEIDGDFLGRVREERPGVLNWLAEGVERLIQRGYLLPPPGHHEAVLSMQFGTDPVELFARLGVEAAPNEHRGITSEDLRQALRAFAEAQDIDTDGWTEVTHMKRLATLLKKLHGAERASRDGRPFYRYVRFRGAPH